MYSVHLLGAIYDEMLVMDARVNIKPCHEGDNRTSSRTQTKVYRNLKHNNNILQNQCPLLRLISLLPIRRTQPVVKDSYQPQRANSW